MQTAETCSDHWSVLSKMTPRYFWLSTVCKGVPSIQISGGEEDNLSLDWNHITLHFETLNCILLSLIQTASWDKSLNIFCWTTAWVVPEHIKAISSANWRSFPYVICADIPFTYTRNNKGPKALPWGMPKLSIDSLVVSRLVYALPVWGTMLTLVQQQRLQWLHNWGVHIMTRDDNDDNDD